MSSIHTVVTLSCQLLLSRTSVVRTVNCLAIHRPESGTLVLSQMLRGNVTTLLLAESRLPLYPEGLVATSTHGQ